MAGSPVWSELDNAQLFALQVQLNLACARSRSTLSKRRQEWFCFMGRLLRTEADLRGVPSPAAPFHASQVDQSPPPL